ncbi:MAG TPA: hypothetical protein VF322_00425 [Gammaproteobacteria bacterium]
MRELEASLAALRFAVDEYAARRQGRRYPHGDAVAVRPNGARAWSGARAEATLVRLRDRVETWLRAMVDKVLGGSR